MVTKPPLKGDIIKYLDMCTERERVCSHPHTLFDHVCAMQFERCFEGVMLSDHV